MHNFPSRISRLTREMRYNFSAIFQSSSWGLAYIRPICQRLRVI